VILSIEAFCHWTIKASAYTWHRNQARNSNRCHVRNITAIQSSLSRRDREAEGKSRGSVASRSRGGAKRGTSFSGSGVIVIEAHSSARDTRCSRKEGHARRSREGQNFEGARRAGVAGD